MTAGLGLACYLMICSLFYLFIREACQDYHLQKWWHLSILWIYFGRFGQSILFTETGLLSYATRFWIKEGWSWVITENLGLCDQRKLDSRLLNRFCCSLWLGSQSALISDKEGVIVKIAMHVLILILSVHLCQCDMRVANGVFCRGCCSARDTIQRGSYMEFLIYGCDGFHWTAP